MKINYDPTVNLGHIGTALTFLLVASAGYYDLKSDVRNTSTVLTLQEQKQQLIDSNQDRRLDEVKATVEKSTMELKLAIERTISTRREDALNTSSNRHTQGR